MSWMKDMAAAEAQSVDPRDQLIADLLAALSMVRDADAKLALTAILTTDQRAIIDAAIAKATTIKDTEI